MGHPKSRLVVAAYYFLQDVMFINASETGIGSGNPLVRVHTEGSTDSCALSVQNVKYPGGECRKNLPHSCRTHRDDSLLGNEKIYELSTCS